MTPEQFAAQYARDRRLVREAQAGDLRAEDRLIRTYRSMALGIAREFSYPGGDDDDVRQEALLGLVRAIRSYDHQGGTAFRTFAQLVVWRHVVTGLKTAQRSKHQMLTLTTRVTTNDAGERIEILDLLPPPYSRDPFLVVVAKERLERSLRGLLKLSDRERLSVLGVASGVPYADIRRDRGWSLKSIDNACQRARMRLADDMADAA